MKKNYLLHYGLLFITLVTLSACSKIISLTTDEPIETDKGERTTGSFIDDEIIETKILVNFDKSSPELAQAHLSATSFNGIVLLTGQVNSEDLRQSAANAAAKVAKVRRVYNEISVSGAISMVARSNDAWITTKLKSKMLIKPEIEGGRVKVITENGIVYLMGLLSKEEGARVADIVRQTGGVQKVVILFEYIN